MMNGTDVGVKVTGNPIEDYFILVVAVVFAVQYVLWIISYVAKTEKLYDLVGAATYLYVVMIRGIATAHVNTVGQTLQAVCIGLWCLRLGGFLFYRVIKVGSDSRFDDIKKSLIKYFAAWTAQALWITINTLPSCFMWWNPGQGANFEWRHGLGLAIWLFAWIFEVIADFQKLFFKNNPDNKGKFITSGLWSISRHPNYFGEITLWFGLFISATVSFPSPWCYFSILCPIWGMCLICWISGVRMLETSAEKRWGTKPEYREYVRKTACLVPFLFCWDPLCVPKPSSIIDGGSEQAVVHNENYQAIQPNKKDD